MSARRFTRRDAFPLAVICFLYPLPWSAAPWQSPTRQSSPRPLSAETLQFSVEWRLIRAGTAQLTSKPRQSSSQTSWQTDLHLESVGLVSKLFRVNDNYSVLYDNQFCATSTYMKAEEGSRRRETNVTFDRERSKSSYLERDLVKNSTVLARELDIPTCVHDVLAGLNRLRSVQLEPGQSVNFPISDGKKSVSAKIEAQEREQLKTPLGTHSAVRYEVFLFNDVLYSRKGRLFVWLSDDDRRLPLQLRVRLQVHIGTITLQLEKVG
jgi:hypothetical protein